MLYEIVIAVALGLMVFRHVRSPHVSAKSKCIVIAMAALCIVLPEIWPSFLPLAGVVSILCFVLAVALAIYLTLHAAYQSRGDSSKTL